MHGAIARPSNAVVRVVGGLLQSPFLGTAARPRSRALTETGLQLNRIPNRVYTEWNCTKWNLASQITIDPVFRLEALAFRE